MSDFQLIASLQDFIAKLSLNLDEFRVGNVCLVLENKLLETQIKIINAYLKDNDDASSGTLQMNISSTQKEILNFLQQTNEKKKPDTESEGDARNSLIQLTKIFEHSKRNYELSLNSFIQEKTMKISAARAAAQQEIENDPKQNMVKELNLNCIKLQKEHENRSKYLQLFMNQAKLKKASLLTKFEKKTLKFSKQIDDLQNDYRRLLDAIENMNLHYQQVQLHVSTSIFPVPGSMPKSQVNDQDDKNNYQKNNSHQNSELDRRNSQINFCDEIPVVNECLELFNVQNGDMGSNNSSNNPKGNLEEASSKQEKPKRRKLFRLEENNIKKKRNRKF